MSLESAFETGRLYGPLRDIADARRDIPGAFLSVPGLRGYWPLSSVASDGGAIDLSGHSQRLEYSGSGTYNTAGPGATYLSLNGTTDYLWGADSSIYDVSGAETYIGAGDRGLTVGGWFWTTSTGTHRLASKWATGSDQRMFVLSNGGLSVSSDGVTLQSALFPAVMTINAWHFVVGRASASSVDVFLDSNKYSGPAAFPLFNSSAELWFGRYLSQYLPGRMSNLFYSAIALSDSEIDNLYRTSRIWFGA